MNVFEELVVELKEENLLEETVVDVQRLAAQDNEQIDRTDEPNKPEDDVPASDAIMIEDEPAAASVSPPAVVDEPIKVKKGPQFYQKRAVAEVSSLQMVEHVLTGVEREYLKVVPKSFDDFDAKKALNAFLNVGGEVDSDEHKAAEFKLMQETEAWCSALAQRDREIPVSSFRLYCENSKPALSSQAMLGLARFYRNLPYSESVRSKFDFIITRLFSRPAEGDKRMCLFSREDALKHVNTLYSEWSSVPLYDVDEDDSKVLLTALSFEELATEAESVPNFDQLIESDFFGRLRLFKESINELFFAPNVTAAAIECNIRIGNAYVDLLERERRKIDDDSLQSKYADLHAETVSDAAARTLDLVELLRNSPLQLPVQEGSALPPQSVEAPAAVRSEPAVTRREQPPKPAGVVAKLAENVRSVNRAFLAICCLLVAVSLGIWLWAATAEEEISTNGVSPIVVEGNFLGEHIKTAKVSQDIFYGMLKPSWDALSKEKRQEFVQQVLAACKDYSCSQVNLLNKDGKVAAYASSTRLDINMP
jgi:hypothetical protein